MGALLDRPLGTVKIAGGTAGTPAGGVTSIQGVAGGTPVPVSTNLATSGKSLNITVTTATTAVQLNTGTSLAVAKGVWIACDLASPGMLSVGWATGDVSVTGFKIPQGTAVYFEVSNTNLFWIGATVNASTGSYAAT